MTKKFDFNWRIPVPEPLLQGNVFDRWVEVSRTRSHAQHARSILASFHARPRHFATAAEARRAAISLDAIDFFTVSRGLPAAVDMAPAAAAVPVFVLLCLPRHVSLSLFDRRPRFSPRRRRRAIDSSI